MKWSFLGVSIYNFVVFFFFGRWTTDVRDGVALVLVVLGLGIFEILRQLEAIKEGK